MAAVALDTRNLDRLPGVCVKTGTPTDTRRQTEFVDVPGWALLLIFWGFIPFLIAAALGSRKVKVDLPASPEIIRKLKAIEVVTVVGLVVAVGALVFAFATSSATPVWIVGGFAVVTLVAAAVARTRVWVFGRLDDDVLRLYGVSPGFVAAVAPLAPMPADSPTGPKPIRALLVVLSVVAVAGMFYLFFRGS